MGGPLDARGIEVRSVNTTMSFEVPDIVGERLILRHLSPQTLRDALAQRFAEAAAALGAALPAAWQEEVAILALRLQDMESDPAYAPWSLRAIILRDSGEVAGHLNFHSQPGHPYLQAWGEVELGYTVLPAFRRQGIAREAVRLAARWAHEEAGVRRFVLSIAPDNLPSQALAARLGFRKVHQVSDPDDGPEDVLIADWPFPEGPVAGRE